jgi:galactokinase/mevalonate kinase-like predicted kinase
MKKGAEQIERMITLPPGMVPHFRQLEKLDAREWFCCSDPEEGKVGSGGGTAHILASAYQQSDPGLSFRDWLRSAKKMVIHSGGDSRRLPAYAPYGKSLLPMPVFRWSKGQYIDQKLLDFQASYYEQILKRAPSCYSLLVGSGDVMFISSDRFHQLPEADVVVFGIWVEDEVASRHGVFFSHREHPDRLAFVKQKPSEKELQELAPDYFYLMDSGMVLLNERTTMKLMAKSGWDESKQRFNGGRAHYYDLYGEMLTAFGQETTHADPGLEGLEVKLVPLHQAEFYHFGSNSDLLESTLRLQNRVTDQRLRFSHETDTHPSIFQQNSMVGVQFTDKNHHIWIENSFISGDWKLSHHHILTGIPESEWQLNLPDGCCLDLVPVGEDTYCVRVYGFWDQFRETPENGGQWMGVPMNDWIENQPFDAREAGLDRSQSLFHLPLFPVSTLHEVPALLGYLLGECTDPHMWLRSERLSAAEIAGAVDPARTYQQREKLQLQSLQRIAAHHSRSIFYYLDLEKVSEAYRANHLKLPAPLAANEPVIKLINDQMFRARVHPKHTQAEQHEKRAFGILREAMIETLKEEPVRPLRNVLDDQILWGRSPVRLDLAGGWTDTPPYCILEGGKVVNLAVELNGQMPLQVFIRPLHEYKIVLRSIDLGHKLEITGMEELHRYDRPGSGFAIPMAALVLAGFSPMFSDPSKAGNLSAMLKAFGCGIEMSLLAAIPKGSGLGTSSNLAATVLGTLSDFCGLHWDKHDIAYRTLILEQMLTTGGGWQDQFGGIFEGVKLLETNPGIQQEPAIKWLPDQLFSNRETKEMMLLYYTGVTRVARDILGEIVKAMFLNSNTHLKIFSEMKAHARETFETILANNYEELAWKVALSWELNQQLDEGTNPPVIQQIIRRVDDYLLGYKLLGAGGGGYLLMFAKSAESAGRARKILENDPPNSRSRFVDFRVSGTGFQLSRS